MTVPLLTKKEVAAQLHISLWSVEQLIKKGSLPVVPVGCRTRIRPEDVDSYINAGSDPGVIVVSAYEK